MTENRNSGLKRRDVLQKGAATGALVAGGTALTGTVAGKRGQGNCTLNWKKELTKSACDGQGSPVINVERKIINGLDSGETRNWWARDTFKQKIQVWETNSGSFCAALTYRGDFDAFAGRTSPGGGGTLSGDEEGPFQGGVRLTIDGTFNPVDTQTRGSLGTVDQGCIEDDGDGDPAEDEDCDFSSTTGWIDDYFDNADESFDWFGFIYHGGNCGTWVNVSGDNCGDILCE
jgi:hypothetical protein